MATSKKSASSSKASQTKSGSKTDMTSKATTKPAKTTKANSESANRAVKERPGASKQVNSGGTKRTASNQAEPTKTRQAKAASSKTTTSKRSSSGGTASSTASASGQKSGGSRSKAGDGDGLVSKLVSKMGNLLKGRPTDAIELLKKDHRLVEGLFEKVKANEDGNNKNVFKRIKLELDTHAHIEERIFYPQLLKKGDEELQKIVREGIEEHRQAKILLGELAQMTGTSETFKARLKVLMEDIEHHVKEEEGDMFPLVEDHFDGKTRERLGARMQAEKTKFKEKQAARSQAAKAAAKTRAAKV